MHKSVAVIINARSGARLGASAKQIVTDCFNRFGIIAHVAVAPHGKDISRLTDEALKGSDRIVVAAGGDGTITSVASKLTGIDRVLGVIPLGTFNFFARNLNIPLDLEQAIRTIVEGRIVKTDAGEVNGHIFLNTSSIGTYPLALRQRDQAYRRFGRHRIVAYLAGGLALLRLQHSMRIRMKVSDEERDVRSEFVFVCNNQTQLEHYQIRGSECLNHRAFAIYLSEPLTRWQRFRLGFQMLIRRLDRAEGFDALCTNELELDSSRLFLEVANDGEIQKIITPLKYRLLPDALKVMVPEGEKQ